MFFLAKGATISWRSKKQTIVASSAMEVEFIGCYKATSQAKWLKNFVFGLKVVNFVERRLKIFCDNSAAIFFLKNNKSESQSRHIDIKFLVVEKTLREN